MQLTLTNICTAKMDARKRNILASPKNGGSCDIDSKPYLQELSIEIIEKKQPIQFTSNFSERVHRWTPYIQGFSANFVQSVFDQYKDQYENLYILDPFAGCGTVLVQSKLNGYRSSGTELNPLLQFIADVKVNCWDISPQQLLALYSSIPRNVKSPSPEFLRSDSHFSEGVLENLELIKGGIASINPKNDAQKKAKDLIRMAFSSIIIDCSTLKRTPCLGYSKRKKVPNNAPWLLLDQKINNIASDLKTLQTKYRDCIDIGSDVICANAMEYRHTKKFDLAITSPPYMNGMDYVMNYKIEMAWLGFTSSHKAAKKIKDEMVVCDNVSKGVIKEFAKSPYKYTNDWIEEIKSNIKKNIEKRGNYRRQDMSHIVHKYFDDLYKIMKNVADSLKPNGRFILVVGDSLIADVYVPTDLLLAKIGTEPEIGLTIEKIEKARGRRSGQVRNYRLRETIITLKKL